LHNGLARLQALSTLVDEKGACSLPGVSINFDLFIPILQRAVARGYVPRHKAQYVFHGLRWGFDLGVDVSLLIGRQRFRNYESAMSSRAQVSDSVRSRVAAGKTLCLGPFGMHLRNALPWAAWRIFPLGAVPKPLEPDKVRPISDHTRSGLKEATDLTLLRHSLNTYDEIAAFLKFGFYMHVGDVDAAFPLLPLHPSLWPFFLFMWFDVDTADLTAPLLLTLLPWDLFCVRRVLIDMLGRVAHAQAFRMLLDRTQRSFYGCSINWSCPHTC
jgi:hypothetical protein